MSPQFDRDSRELLNLLGDTGQIHRAIHHGMGLFHTGGKIDLINSNIQLIEDEHLELDPGNNKAGTVAAARFKHNSHIFVTLKRKGLFIDGLVTLGASDAAEILYFLAVDDTDLFCHRFSSSPYPTGGRD